MMIEPPEDEHQEEGPDADASSDASEVIDAAWFVRRFPSREQLEELLAGDPVATLLQLAKTRAPIELGPEGDPSTLSPKLAAMLQLAQSAAKSLAKDPYKMLSVEEIEAMHAFTHLVARPSLQVADGIAVGIPQTWPRLEQDRDVIRERLRAVGRLDSSQGWPCGTGWLVGEQRLLTNNHVVGALVGLDVHGDPRWRERLGDMVAQVNDEWARDEHLRPRWDPGDSPSGHSTARVSRIIATHAKADMAMLEVVGVADGSARVLRISRSQPGDLQDEMVYVPGYPVVAPRLDLPEVIVDLLFGGASARVIKRIAPGRLRGLADATVFHDASTLGGSSGSPILSFESHEVVGLHFGGKYATRNNAVALWTLRDDVFFA